MRTAGATIRTRFRLLAELVRRDVRARFAGSRFGLLWSLLNPLLQIVSYGLIFGVVYRGSTDVPRGLFVATLFCGLWPWWAFQEGVVRGMTALVDQAPLLKKMPIPPALCVIAQVMGTALLQAAGFLVFLVLFAMVGILPVSARLLWLPAVALLGALLSVGIGLVLAPLHLVIRDTAHVVNAGLTLLFFASPVLYRIEALPPSVRGIAAANPVAGLIGLYRAVVLGQAVEPIPVAACFVATVLSWVLGLALLERLAGVLDEYW
jgi:ABC-type polysaccharide/polyol phosphate export permease